MNTHEDNLKDLVIIYCEEHGLSKYEVEEMVKKETFDEWAERKTETSIKEIIFN